MLGDSTVDEVAEAYALYTGWHLERSITSNDAVDNPSLASRELSPTGRYFWSEVISLGGYDVLVKPSPRYIPDDELGMGELER